MVNKMKSKISYNFKSKYTFDFNVNNLVEFTESKRKNAKKLRGWILAIEFSGEAQEPLIIYTIQGYDSINKKGTCYIYESIAEDQIIRTIEIE